MLGVKSVGANERPAYLPWRRTVAKEDGLRERNAMFEKLAGCAAKRIREVGSRGGQRSTRKLSVVLSVDSGGREEEQPLRLELEPSVGLSAKRRY